MSIRPHQHPRTGLKGFRADVSRVIAGRLVRLTEVVYGTRRESERVEAKLRHELVLRQGGEIPLEDRGERNPSWGDLVTAYLAFSKISHRGTRAHVDQSRALLSYFGDDKPARSIRHDDVVRFLAWRRKQRGPSGRPISPATADKELGLLKRIFAHAIQNRRLDPPHNPAVYVKPARIPVHRERVVSDEEFLRLLEELRTPVHRAILLFARYTGLRSHHVLSLDWSQIGRDGLIRPAGFRPDESLYLSTKRFGLPPVPWGLLSAIPHEPQSAGPLWVWRGRGLQHVRNAFTAARGKVGLDDLWFHDLRRTYATQLRRMGVDILVAMTILGHAVPRELDIHHRYQVVSVEEIQGVAALLSSDPGYLAALGLCTRRVTENWKRIK